MPLALVNEMKKLKTADGGKHGKNIEGGRSEVTCVTFTYQQHPARLTLA